MKKRIGAWVLSLALLTGVSASADDWVLPLGERVPLKDVTVWNGHDGYFGEKINAVLTDPEVVQVVQNDLTQELLALGLFEAFSDEEAEGGTTDAKKLSEDFAKNVLEIFQKSRVYQLRLVKDNVMHTAVAISVPFDLTFTEEQKKFFGDVMEGEDYSWDEHWNSISSDQIAENFEMMWGTSVKETDEKVGRSHGISYRSGKIVMTAETEGWQAPIFLYWLVTKKDDKVSVSYVLANQTAGKVFGPILKKAVRDLK